MKIAWLHSTFTEGNNGAERLVYMMAKEFGSKIYTCAYNERVEGSYPGIRDMLVVDEIADPGSFTKMPEQVMRTMTERSDIDADFIVHSGNLPIFRVLKDPTPYLYFCHTPERGFFDLREKVLLEINSWGFPKNMIARAKFDRRRKRDMDLFRNHVNPKQVVTNSNLIMNRYEKAYGKRPRRSVGAPIDTKMYSYKEPEDFFFTASGLRWNKRIEWQIEAVAKTGHELKIAGDGPQRKKLENLAKDKGADVEFLGRLDEKDLIDNYSRCKAFIFTAKEEDFGMVPLEAMASGKPVLCVREGGPLEYLNDENSFLFNDIDGLVNILKTKNNDDFAALKDRCIKDAKRFDTREVAKRVREDIDGIMKEFYGGR